MTNFDPIQSMVHPQPRAPSIHGDMLEQAHVVQVRQRAAEREHRREMARIERVRKNADKTT
jgi:hypothetical protein